MLHILLEIFCKQLNIKEFFWIKISSVFSITINQKANYSISTLTTQLLSTGIQHVVLVKSGEGILLMCSLKINRTKLLPISHSRVRVPLQSGGSDWSRKKIHKMVRMSGVGARVLQCKIVLIFFPPLASFALWNGLVSCSFARDSSIRLFYFSLTRIYIGKIYCHICPHLATEEMIDIIWVWCDILVLGSWGRIYTKYLVRFPISVTSLVSRVQ